MVALSHGEVPEFTINNEPLVTDWMCVEAGYGCDYMYTNFTVTHGLHEVIPVSSLTRFLMWSYGFALYRAYGMVSGWDGKKVSEMS